MDNLPKELLWKILYYLDNLDYLRFSLLSKKFRFAVMEDNRKGVIKISKRNYRIFIKRFKTIFNLDDSKFNLDLHSYELKDLELFSNIHILNLSGNKTIRDYDIRCLKNIYNLNLSHTNIKDVSILGKPKGFPGSAKAEINNIKILNLSFCKYLTDVSNLGNVYELDLSHTNIIDVSNLGNVKILDLSNCEKIIDVSNLGNVSDLNLEECFNLSNIDKLKNNKILNLSCCAIDDSILNNFKNIKKLSICSTNIYSINYLDISNINYLDISYTSVSDISMIINMHTLILDGLKIDNFSSLKNIYKLSLRDCRLNNIDFLKDINVSILSLSNNYIKDISILKNKNITELDLSHNGYGFKNINILGDNKNIKKLYLRGCSYITDISALKNIQYLDIRECYNIVCFDNLNPKNLIL